METKITAAHKYSTDARVCASGHTKWNFFIRIVRDCTATNLFGFLGAVEALKLFAGLEADGFAGRDVDFFAGAGIAADAGFARLDAKDAEAAELDALSAAESLLERFENGFDGLFGLGAADARRTDDRVYDVQLNHTSLRGFRGQMLEGAAWVVKT